MDSTDFQLSGIRPLGLTLEDAMDLHHLLSEVTRIASGELASLSAAERCKIEPELRRKQKKCDDLQAQILHVWPEARLRRSKL